MPQHYTNFLKLLKLYEKRPTCFQTLTFCRNLSFQKPWICPWIFQGFSMDFPPHGFSGRPRERPTKNKIGRQGRISRLPEGSLEIVFPYLIDLSWFPGPLRFSGKVIFLKKGTLQYIQRRLKMVSQGGQRTNLAEAKLQKNKELGTRAKLLIL